MTLEMTTNWLNIIEPGLYGTNLGSIYEDIDEEYTETFKRKLCLETVDIMNEMFSEDWFVEKFGNYVVSNAELLSPRFYNYENDSIEFDLFIDKPEIIEAVYREYTDDDLLEFYNFTYDNYGSRSGFISFFPYKRADFEKALLNTEYNKEGGYDFNRAVAMLLVFEFNKNNCSLDSYQKDLETNMEDYCCENGLFYYDFFF